MSFQGYTTTDGTHEPLSLASESSAPSSLRPANNNCHHNNNGSVQQNGAAPGNGTNNNTRYPQSNLSYGTQMGFSTAQSSISTNPNHIDGSPTASHNRRSPEGKDNEMSSLGYMQEDSKKMLVNNNALASQRNSAASSADLTATEIYTASNENGKINVQVTVLFGEYFQSFHMPQFDPFLAQYQLIHRGIKGMKVDEVMQFSPEFIVRKGH